MLTFLIGVATGKYLVYYVKQYLGFRPYCVKYLSRVSYVINFHDAIIFSTYISSQNVLLYIYKEIRH